MVLKTILFQQDKFESWNFVWIQPFITDTMAPYQFLSSCDYTLL